MASTRLANRDEPIPGYRLMERLGRGGFGEVWKCEAPGGLHKAIKFVYGDIESMGEDGKPAEQELKALNRIKTIRHPYILSLERFEVIEGQLVIVMELADRNLWDRFRECRAHGQIGIPREELLGYMAEAAEALDLMNQAYHIQHLDIKPQNIFLVHNHIKVADFGLAKDLEGMRATITGGVTPVYAAPETFDGEVSAFCDQYSLAILYQELLTGKRPFNGTNTRQLLVQHMSGQPDISPLPESDRRPILRALSKIPNERFATVTDLVQALREGDGQGETVAGSNPNVAPSTPRMPAGRPRPILPPVRPMSSPRPSGGTPALPGVRGEDGMQPRPARPSMRGGHSLPALTTPGQMIDGRGVLPPASSSAQHTLNRLGMPPATLVARTLQAPPEQHGDGSLFPALVIGLGRTGREVIKHVRETAAEWFGPAVTLPHIHFLHIDTDPNAIQKALSPQGASQLPPFSTEEVFHARLNRPSYYLKREGMPPVEKWMSTQLLYRMPRNPRTNGLRAFGRLALCDHYRGIMARIRACLEEFTNSQLLNQADEQTKLGLRTNRPRVYIVAGLGGATGSGMFIDLAYMCRYELRAMGYRQPEVIGVFPMPPASLSSSRTTSADQRSITNCFAALTELHHFSSPGTCYEAHFDDRDHPIIDADRPFFRCIFTGHASPNGAGSSGDRGFNLTAQVVSQELISPLGRLLDESRENYLASVAPEPGAWCQAVGVYRLSWPHRLIGRWASRRLVLHLLKKWSSKEIDPFRKQLADWFNEEWRRRQLDAQTIIDTLHESAQTTLGRPPDQLFSEILAPVNDPEKPSHRYDAMSGLHLLDQIVELIGRPEADKEIHPGTLTVSLTEFGRTIIKQGEKRLIEMSFQFLEQPDYRLPAADAVVELLTEKIKATLAALEARIRDLDAESRDTITRALAQIGTLASRKAGLTKEVVRLLNEYAPKRYQCVILQAVRAIYRSILGSLPDIVRDLQYCRQRLTELVTELTKAAGAEDVASADASLNSSNRAGSFLFPVGCHSVKSACEQALSQMPSEQIKAMEDQLQARIRRTFGSVAQACGKGTTEFSLFRALCEEIAGEFVEKLIPRLTAADVFVERLNEDTMTAHREIHTAFDEASPDVPVPRDLYEAELNLLAMPQNEAGSTLWAMISEVLADEQLTPGPSASDVIFHREIRRLPMNLLPQLGVSAQTLYEQARADPAAPPHSRTDIPWHPPRRS